MPSAPPMQSPRKVHISCPTVSLQAPQRLQTAVSAACLQGAPGMRPLPPSWRVQSSLRAAGGLPLSERGRGHSPHGTVVLPAARGGPARSSSGGGRETAPERPPPAFPGPDPPALRDAASPRGQAGLCAGAGADEVLTALAALQSNLERQQREQRSLISALTAQWEQRFAAVLQCLKTATGTAASMNERSSKFLHLSEVLESALDQMSSDSKDVSALTQKIGTLEASVRWLTEEIAETKAERAKWFGNAVCLDMSGGPAEHGGTDQVKCSADGGPHGAGDATLSLQRWPNAALERLACLIDEESAERRKLSREVQGVISEMHAVRGKLDGADDQLLRLARELGDARSEVHRVAGELSRMWSAESSGESSIHRAEFRSELAQRADSLAREFRGDLAAPVLPVRTGGDSGSPCPDAARLRLTALGAPPAHRAVGAPRAEPLRADLVKEIAAAMASTGAALP
uniref:Uncharacterized protein n=1 Tax=Alexandrium monilatum TaxID=311494 RepID=A0A7S4VVI1_9DINO